MSQVSWQDDGIATTRGFGQDRVTTLSSLPRAVPGEALTFPLLWGASSILGKPGWLVTLQPLTSLGSRTSPPSSRQCTLKTSLD